MRPVSEIAAKLGLEPEPIERPLEVMLLPDFDTWRAHAPHGAASLRAGRRRGCLHGAGTSQHSCHRAAPDAQRERLAQALFLSVNGIAAAMQSTG